MHTNRRDRACCTRLVQFGHHGPRSNQSVCQPSPPPGLDSGHEARGARGGRGCGDRGPGRKAKQHGQRLRVRHDLVVRHVGPSHHGFGDQPVQPAPTVPAVVSGCTVLVPGRQCSLFVRAINSHQLYDTCKECDANVFQKRKVTLKTYGPTVWPSARVLPHLLHLVSPQPKNPDPGVRPLP